MNKHIDTIPESTIQKLQRWPCPGNAGPGEFDRTIGDSHLQQHALGLAAREDEFSNRRCGTVGNSDERKRIVGILRETKGRIAGPNGAAFRLGIKRGTPLDRMKKLGIV